jgi:hypothetical protein
MKSSPPTTSPLKTALEEIDSLSQLFDATLEAYRSGVTSKLAILRETVEKGALKKRIPADLIRDARDIVMVIRHLEVKPDKGRRRDLKKMEEALGDIQLIIEKWKA